MVRFRQSIAALTNDSPNGNETSSNSNGDNDSYNRSGFKFHRIIRERRIDLLCLLAFILLSILNSIWNKNDNGNFTVEEEKLEENAIENNTTNSSSNNNNVIIKINNNNKNQNEYNNSTTDDIYVIGLKSLLLKTGVECTSDHVSMIQKQLSDSKCVGDRPWAQQCSLTKATGCVEAKWLFDHYRYDYKQQLPMTTSETGTDNDELWIGINIGCNKGFDAINIGRMLSDDTSTFDRDRWKIPMQQQGVNIDVGCELKSAQYEPKIDRQVSTRKRSARVFCVEPMPLTVQALENSATTLQIPSIAIDTPNTTSTLTIIKAAIGKSTMEKGVLFPAIPQNTGADHMKVQIGTENIGLGSSSTKCDPKIPESCEEIPVLSLDDFISKYDVLGTTTKEQVSPRAKIKMITIDVEGYDFDVVLGGINTLQTIGVEYVEVEYNWMGSWKSRKSQHLTDFIQYMQHGNFVCYWAGQARLWRITGCYLEFYDYHTWSNIACVNPIRNPRLASRMEQIFLNTINNTSIQY